MRAPAAHPLLIGILRGEDATTLAPRVPGPRDWPPLLDQAAAHGVGRPLHRWLAASGVGRTLPASVVERLARQVFEQTARSMLLAGELAGLLRALEAAGVPCVPLRGPALAERLYGDVTARPMGDLDLLVCREDLPRVGSVLRALGFEPLDRRPGFALAFSYTLTFLKARHGWVIVEPHWTIVYPPFVERLDMAGVWERSVRERVLGVETRALAREDLLLHLALHLAHPDGGAPLLWWHELDRLIAREKAAIDWALLLAVARSAGVEGLLADVLGTATALFRTPVPADVRDGLAAVARRPPGGRLPGRLAAAVGVEAREEVAVLFALRGWRERLRYVTGLLFPCREFMRVQWGIAGRRALALGYLRRAARLAATALRAMLGLLWRSRPPEPVAGSSGPG